MTTFYISSDSQPKKNKGLQCYSVEERKLMADILYEEQNSKRCTANTKFDSDERRLMAEIARENDLEEKANQRKNSEEKREQMKQKREEKDAERKAKALMKLRRVESITKPDLVSDKVKQYDLKRADVLDRQKSKDAMRKIRLERSMSREKPDTVSDVAKKYNERRAEVLERIQKKQENIKTNYEKKMNKPLPDRGKSRDGMENATLQSGNINAKVQDETGRYYTSEGSENVQSENTKRFASSKRSNRRMTFDVLDGISDVDNILEVVEEEAPAVTNVLNGKSPSNNSDTESGYFTEQTTDRSSSGHHRSLSRYNSFDTKSVLPRIECK